MHARLVGAASQPGTAFLHAEGHPSCQSSRRVGFPRLALSLSSPHTPLGSLTMPSAPAALTPMSSWIIWLTSRGLWQAVAKKPSPPSPPKPPPSPPSPPAPDFRESFASALLRPKRDRRYGPCQPHWRTHPAEHHVDAAVSPCKAWMNHRGSTVVQHVQRSPARSMTCPCLPHGCTRPHVGMQTDPARLL